MKTLKSVTDTYIKASDGKEQELAVAPFMAAVEHYLGVPNVWTIARYMWHGGEGEGSVLGHLPPKVDGADEIVRRLRAIPTKWRCRFVPQAEWDKFEHHLLGHKSKNTLLLLTDK